MPPVFVSYAHAPHDETVSAWLRAFLHRGGVPTWCDVESLRARSGGALNAEIAAAIAASSAVAAVVSSHSLASEYCRAELIRAMEVAKPIVRLDIEVVARLPDVLLPLPASARARVELHRLPRPGWPGQVAEAFSACGVGIDGVGVDSMEFGGEARLIRPNYLRLRRADGQTLRAIVGRLGAARELNPDNGYTQLSLALLWLHQGDAARALAAAGAAVERLPDAADAHHALALAQCLAAPPTSRSMAQTEAILRRLAVARRLPRAGSHIDLLSALVIANYYLPRYLHPPSPPEELLARGLEGDRPFDGEETLRVLDLEPLRTAPCCRHLRPMLIPYKVADVH